VEEISSALIEEGTVQLKDNQAGLTNSLENLSFPNTAQAVIRARLDRRDGGRFCHVVSPSGKPEDFRFCAAKGLK
jgi:hypothetical protein